MYMDPQINSFCFLIFLIEPILSVVRTSSQIIFTSVSLWCFLSNQRFPFWTKLQSKPSVNHLIQQKPKRLTKRSDFTKIIKCFILESIVLFIKSMHPATERILHIYVSHYFLSHTDNSLCESFRQQFQVWVVEYFQNYFKC